MKNSFGTYSWEIKKQGIHKIFKIVTKSIGNNKSIVLYNTKKSYYLSKTKRFSNLSTPSPRKNKFGWKNVMPRCCLNFGQKFNELSEIYRNLKFSKHKASIFCPTGKTILKNRNYKSRVSSLILSRGNNSWLENRKRYNIKYNS